MSVESLWLMAEGLKGNDLSVAAQATKEGVMAMMQIAPARRIRLSTTVLGLDASAQTPKCVKKML
jgi:hypothetical protein